MNSQHNPDVAIAVTGTAWIGGDVQSVQTAIETLLESARNEVQAAIYELTAGAEPFLDEIQSCLARGIKVTMIVNRLEEKPAVIKRRLKMMTRRYPYFSLLSFRPVKKFEDFHAKILVRDRREALVGSANMTWNGLVGNHELAVVVSGRVASKIGSLVDMLANDSRVSSDLNWD